MADPVKVDSDVIWNAMTPAQRLDYCRAHSAPKAQSSNAISEIDDQIEKLGKLREQLIKNG
jgi:hypothetical protein